MTDEQLEKFIQRKAEAYGDLVHGELVPRDGGLVSIDADTIAEYTEHAHTAGIRLGIKIGEARERLKWLEQQPACGLGVREAITETEAELRALMRDDVKQGTTVCQHGTPTDRACEVCLVEGGK